jgi:hypothetical protein
VIRTLTQDELLTVPLLIKEWRDTIGEAKAYTTAVVSLAVISVDDEMLPMPVIDSDNGYAWAYQRFNYVKSRWFQFTIDTVYDRYLTLEAEAQKVVDAMGKASGSTDLTPGSNVNSDEPSDKGS